eukprot:PITA_34820
MLDFERDNILAEAHGGAKGGHYAGKTIAQKILCTGLWWATLHKDSKAYSPREETGTRYIVTMTEYLTKWVEAQLVKDCTGATVANFLFEYALTRFGCMKVSMSDKGTHFLNETINVLIEVFQVYHQKSTQYHPQANGIVEAFNKILENALTNICNA